MVLVKKWPFFQLFFLGSIRQEHVFYDILEGENAFLGYKNKKFKKPKNDNFRNGLNHGFGPNGQFSTFFFSWQYWQGKCVLRYSRTKKRLFKL